MLRGHRRGRRQLGPREARLERRRVLHGAESAQRVAERALLVLVLQGPRGFFAQVPLLRELRPQAQPARRLAAAMEQVTLDAMEKVICTIPRDDYDKEPVHMKEMAEQMDPSQTKLLAKTLNTVDST